MSGNLPQQWLDKAAEDLAVARLVLEEEFFSHVCFLAQQSIEKALKGYLLSKIGTYPRTHGLVDLLRQCGTFDPAISQFTADCARIDQYYTPARYPDAIPGTGPDAEPGQTEAEKAVNSADTILLHIKTQLS